MSIQVDDKREIRAALTHAAGPGAAVGAVANAAQTRWTDIAAQLEPVLGESGVRALFARCLHLQRIAPGDAEALAPSPTQPPAFEALRRALEAQSPAGALELAVGFFDGFGTLLASLIGATLTARLLNPVWADGHTDQPDQEKQP